jgi:hypothetical protein
MLIDCDKVGNFFYQTMNMYEVNYQFVPVYIPPFMFCSMLAHVLQAPLSLDVAVA